MVFRKKGGGEMQHPDNEPPPDFEKILEDCDHRCSSVAPPKDFAGVMVFAFVALPAAVFVVILFVFYMLRVN